jgi:maltose O-acetyltransferase
MDIPTSIKKIILYASIKKRQQYIKRLIENGLNLGKNVEIIDTFFFDPSHCFLISIGDNCTICPNVRLIAHDASTKKILGYTKIGKITIEQNCFIGDSAIILPGVKIGPNSIIGAGSVITKNIPPNAIAAGNPAKVIFSMDKYINKIEAVSKEKKIFDKEYFIENLDTEKRKEISKSIGDTIGFIV